MSHIYTLKWSQVHIMTDIKTSVTQSNLVKHHIFYCSLVTY